VLSHFLLFPEKEAKSVVPLRGRSQCIRNSGLFGSVLRERKKKSFDDGLHHEGFMVQREPIVVKEVKMLVALFSREGRAKGVRVVQASFYYRQIFNY
jgi:hypothetical protein